MLEFLMAAFAFAGSTLYVVLVGFVILVAIYAVAVETHDMVEHARQMRKDKKNMDKIEEYRNDFA